MTDLQHDATLFTNYFRALNMVLLPAPKTECGREARKQVNRLMMLAGAEIRYLKDKAEERGNPNEK